MRLPYELIFIFYIVTKIKRQTFLTYNNSTLINLNVYDLTLFYNNIEYFNKDDEWNQNLFWYYNYQQYFLSAILNIPVYLKYINIKKIIPSQTLKYLSYSVSTINWKRFHIIHGNEILEMIFLSLWVKNLNILIKWIRKYFEKHHLKKHKKLFSLLSFLFGKLIWEYNLYFRLKGLRVAVRGKFGKAGSVRKSRRYIKRGKCSYSSKKLALTHATKFIRTLTGTFSYKMELFY